MDFNHRLTGRFTFQHNNFRLLLLLLGRVYGQEFSCSRSMRKNRAESEEECAKSIWCRIPEISYIFSVVEEKA